MSQDEESMRQLDRLSGSVILCDVAQPDRGKLNILGAGWSVIGPTTEAVTTIVNVQIPPTEDYSQLTIQVKLWRRGPFTNGGDPDAEAELIGGLDREEGEDPKLPSWQILAPVPLQASLRPTTDYVVELSVGGESLAFTTFKTRDYPPD